MLDLIIARMGDVGALALGGALGTIAVIVRQEIVLFIMTKPTLCH